MDYSYNNNNNVPLFVSTENVFWKNETFFFFLESYVIFPVFGSDRENELENVF